MVSLCLLVVRCLVSCPGVAAYQIRVPLKNQLKQSGVVKHASFLQSASLADVQLVPPVAFAGQEQHLRAFGRLSLVILRHAAGQPLQPL